jgi:hypothetical protein
LGESLRIWEKKFIPSSRKWYNPVTVLKPPYFIVIRLLFGLKEGPKWKTNVFASFLAIFFPGVAQ